MAPKIEQFIQAGYREFPKPVTHRDADKFAQKRVLDGEGQTLFFINVYFYSWVMYGVRIWDIQVETRLYSDDPPFSFDVRPSVQEDAPVESIEVWLRSVHERLGCKTDPHNND